MRNGNVLYFFFVGNLQIWCSILRSNHTHFPLTTEKYKAAIRVFKGYFQARVSVCGQQSLRRYSQFLIFNIWMKLKNVIKSWWLWTLKKLSVNLIWMALFALSFDELCRNMAILLLIKEWKTSIPYTLFKINKMIITVTGKWQFHTFGCITKNLHIHKHINPLPTSHILVNVVKVFWNSKIFINFIFFKPKLSFGPGFYCKYVIYKGNKKYLSEFKTQS